MELCIEFAATKRRPIKVLADLMGVEVKTLYRWLSDTSMPLNRIRQFETFCGKSFVSEYLCMAQGDKVVVTIPSGKKAGVLELAQVQGAFADAMSKLVRFYESEGDVDETVSAITGTLVQLAYQRENVLKAGTPELDLFEGDE
jgi:predicted DNA-binding transcriptional regulator AlpA